MSEPPCVGIRGYDDWEPPPVDSIETCRTALLKLADALQDDELPLEEFLQLWTAVGIAGADANSFIRERIRGRFIGPRVFCRTPTGRFDGHGVMLQTSPGGPTVCAFCGRPAAATPEDPDGSRVLVEFVRRQRRPAARRHRAAF